MATGLVNDGSNLYAMGASGAMQTGWALVDGAWYHAAESGVLDAGWYWDGSHWYWLDLETRAMATGNSRHMVSITTPSLMARFKCLDGLPAARAWRYSNQTVP